MARILLVEDDAEVAEMITFTLGAEGHELVVAGDADAALAEFKLLRPELVILDVSLPGRSGLELCAQIRAISRVPVLFLTGRGLLQDKIRGFSVGGDDYIVKPFLPTELALRVEALLRRSAWASQPEGVTRAGDLEVDPASGVVRRAGEPVRLSPMERDILVALASTPGIPWTAERLARRLGLQVESPAEAAELMYVKMNRLRGKVEPDPHNPRYVRSQRHAGYWLATDPDPADTSDPTELGQLPVPAARQGDNLVTD
jgi:two-component system response regulator MtrA